MSHNVLAHGITTATYVLGLSAVTGLPQTANVIRSKVLIASGGTLFVSGVSGAIASGVAIPSAVYPLIIDGPAGFYLTCVGATTTVTVMRELAEGYVGSASSNAGTAGA